MKNKIIVIGLGNVGRDYVYSLINQNLNIDEIIIIDINEVNTIGEILDLNHSLPFINNNVKIKYGEYKDCKNANLVVITAGAKQNIGETRMDLIFKNAKIFKDIINNVVKSGFQGIFLNATNPLDVMTQLIYQYSNFPFSKIIGSGTSLDTARFKFNLQEIFDTDYNKIKGYVLGEHGDSSIISWSNTTVDNKLVINSLSLEQKEYIEKKVKNAGYELLNTKGFSSEAIGICLADITRAIINNEKREICVSCYDQENDIYYGYPCIIGKDGILKRNNINLDQQEQNNLKVSINIIKDAIEKIS